MGSSDIQAWIASTELEDNAEGSLVHWQDSQKDWNNFFEYSKATLLSSRTKSRIQFIQEELLPLCKNADLTTSQTSDIFWLLTLTYPRYIDGTSRDLVESVGIELIRRETSGQCAGIIDFILGWLSTEVKGMVKNGSSSSSAPTNLYVLLSWCCGIFSICVQSEKFDSTVSYDILIDCIGQLTYILMHPSTHAKPSVRKSALVRLRRSLRCLPSSIDLFVKKTLMKAKAHSNPMVLFPILGIAIDVGLYLAERAGSGLFLTDEMKNSIIQVYLMSIIMSKVPVPSHVSIALSNFIKISIADDDLNAMIPTFEKAFLRSPEISLPVMTDFFNAYARPLDHDKFKRLLSQILNCSKSNNSETRAGSIRLFEVIMRQNGDPNNVDMALTEILAAPKSGKTSGADHRQTLYKMLSSLKVDSNASQTLVRSAPSLIVKETNDSVVHALMCAIVPHFKFILENNEKVPDEFTKFCVQSLNSTKPFLRGSVSVMVGGPLWDCFEKSIGIDSEIKNIFTSPLDSVLSSVASSPSNADPLQGYVAAALLLGPLSGHTKSVQSLLTSSTKPSFVLSDKIYQKAKSEEEEIWLLRLLSLLLTSLDKSGKDLGATQLQLGLVFVHLVVNSQNPSIRRSTVVELEKRHRQFPSLVNRMLCDAIMASLAHGTDELSQTEDSGSSLKEARLINVLSACSSFDDSVPPELKNLLLSELLIPAHCLSLNLGNNSQQIWIDICQRAKADLQTLISDQSKHLLEVVYESANSDSSMIRKAAFTAATTLSLVAPSVVVPSIVLHIETDLNPIKIKTLSETDIAIWQTPEGTLFHDVLSSKKNGTVNKKGKDAEVEKWEADIRKSLTNKKGTTTSALSKADLAVMEKQLKNESSIRHKVTVLKNDLLRGLELVNSLVRANVEEVYSNMWSMVSIILDGVVKHAATLVAAKIFEVYLNLATCCSIRLGLFRELIGIATLRIHCSDTVPDDFRAEPLNSLISRVLYRIRFFAEQGVFDQATFCYVTPLISHVILTGGILGFEDDPLEQVTLALDFIRFHCGEFASNAYPREKIIHDLIHFIRKHPQLGKDTASALIEIGEAIHSNATPAEVSVLISNILSEEVYIRNAVLQCLQPFDLTDLDWSPELWIVCHDTDIPNATLARHIWNDNGLDIPESFFEDLSKLLEHEIEFVRASCALSLTEATEHWPQSFSRNCIILEDMYREKAKILAPEFDQYGILLTESINRADPWPVRVAIAQAFEALAPYFSEDQIEPFIRFLLSDGALGDRHPDVRRSMLDAASKVIDLHGTRRLQSLISSFEECLVSSSTTGSNDHVQEAVVILLGRIARHMPPGDSRISGTVNRLVEALKIPSEQIQLAVSDCLTPLISRSRDSALKLLDDLLHQLFNASKYGERRGAAYGLAGIVKGLGIASLKEYDILERLKTAMEDKKRFESRQGVMFALETLSATLGRNFEPYIIQLLPLLLSSFGDSIPDVREATQDAAKVIMGNLSGYGVKLILPALLASLEEKQWRTKKGSIELLGTMAFCSPSQLSISLPTVIPRLTSVLTDSHAQVRAAANSSLKQFGEVISNPEVQSLVPVLLKALVDPARTVNALTSLLNTSFMHYIDSPSLALLMPIIERGLRERSADTKKKAAQIVGNLASLTDSHDFTPYLSRLVPLVHVVLVDPVPEARATAAKALGTLIERLGEMHFPDMVPGLLRTLKTDTSGVDRQGAAQGLSEVLAGLGMERLESLLPDIVSNAQAPRSTVREGFMSLLVYLPATFGSRFQPHLPKIVPPILSGLSDSEEYVREAAMRAGRMIINNYSNKAIDLLLPELERGMFDSSWRIRHSSITLVGELLFKLTGISGKAEVTEDEEDVGEVTGGENARKILLEVLGKDRRDRVLASFYIIRQDSVHVVRQSGIHIWKVLVQNTPRTVRELLPELLHQIIFLITDENMESQETADRTVGELSRKFGEKVLAEIISILYENSKSPDSRIREGVCLSLSEIMQSATDNQLEDYDNGIVSIVRNSLVDDDASVRAAAARAFDVLQEQLGPKAIDQTIPTLLEALRQPGASSGTALQALKEVMNVRANTVFPVLIPTLTATPMTAFNARALASLVTVAGSALSKRLTIILTTLVKERQAAVDEDLRAAIDEATLALFRSVSDLEGLNTLMLLLLEWAKTSSPPQRAKVCQLFGLFCEENEMDDTLYRVDWVRELVSLLDDREESVHTAAWNALDIFTKNVPKDELEPLVVPLRRAIESTGAPGRSVPGFSVAKGVAPMVPIIVAGLISGTNEQREQAAYAISDLVERTEEAAIKPYVVPFTGPLIRVTTQAATYPPGVKSAILQALTTMLIKIPTFVKPFFPQLQRTFIKSVADPISLAVRNKACTAIGVLMKSQPRVDPVIIELLAGARGEDETISASHVYALADVVKNAKTNFGEKARESCVELVADAFRDTHDEHYIQAIASLFASLSIFPDLLKPLIQQYLLPGTPPSTISSHAILAVLSMEEEGDNDTFTENIFDKLGVIPAIQRKIQENISSERPSIARPAREAKELLKYVEG